VRHSFMQRRRVLGKGDAALGFDRFQSDRAVVAVPDKTTPMA
jgi:hypothetical protein